MKLPNDDTQEYLNLYQVRSRLEIIVLLRSIHHSRQIIWVSINGSTETMVTSLLSVDEKSNIVIFDAAPTKELNKHLASGSNISFETSLELIRILFFSDQLEECVYEGLPALSMVIPTRMIRLQRREFYRVKTPLVNPVRCMIHILQNDNEVATTLSVSLQNVSGGGLAIVDESKKLNPFVGQIFENCRIELPEGKVVTANLQIRNIQELKMINGKEVSRFGCLFIDLPAPMLTLVQRYTTKLEREQSARSSGIS